MRSPRAAPPSPFNCGGAECTAAPRLAAAAFAISAVLPSAAPAGGGTSVVLHGVGLRDYGSLMRCAWNHTQYGVQHTEALPDSTDGSGGARALRCATPPLAQLGRAAKPFPAQKAGLKSSVRSPAPLPSPASCHEAERDRPGQGNGNESDSSAPTTTRLATLIRGARTAAGGGRAAIIGVGASTCSLLFDV